MKIEAASEGNTPEGDQPLPRRESSRGRSAWFHIAMWKRSIAGSGEGLMKTETDRRERWSLGDGFAEGWGGRRDIWRRKGVRRTIARLAGLRFDDDLGPPLWAAEGDYAGRAEEEVRHRKDKGRMGVVAGCAAVRKGRENHFL